MRIIRCVWRGGRKPAGNNCESSDRPTVVRACVGIDNRSIQPTCPPTIVMKVPLADAEPFKGWRNWRGWELYRWDPNVVKFDDDGARSLTNGNWPIACYLLLLTCHIYVNCVLIDISDPDRPSMSCMDESRFCSIVKLFRNCDQSIYRTKCCFTCRYYFPHLS